MSEKTKTIVRPIIAGVLLPLFVVLLVIVFKSKAQPPLVRTGCTMEALICPDGSGVGRSGPSCEFSPCPSSGALTGVYLNDAQGARLAVSAPQGVGTGVSYAVLLDAAGFIPALDFVGTTVVLDGSFTKGNIFRAEHFATNSPQIPSTATRTLVKLGETKFVGGVNITLSDIVADSRCPVDVQCIQAGSVRAKVTLQSDTDKETLELTSAQAPHKFDTYQVSIVGITPAARSGVHIEKGEYVLTFLVDAIDAGKRVYQ